MDRSKDIALLAFQVKNIMDQYHKLTIEDKHSFVKELIRSNSTKDIKEIYLLKNK